MSTLFPRSSPLSPWLPTVLSASLLACLGCADSVSDSSAADGSTQPAVADAGQESADAGPPSGTWLSISGNRIVAPDGTPWQGRGANIQDTRGCNACAYGAPDPSEVKRRIDVLVDDWGADFLRLTLEAYPSADGRVHWQGPLEDADYLADIKEIVDHVGTKPGVYIMVSLWIHPSQTDLGWPSADSIPVWERLTSTFRHDGQVIFGLVNEPQRNYDGSFDAEVWTAMNDVVAAIRRVEDSSSSRRHVIAVQGTGGWSRFLDYYIDHPITAGGGDKIAYEVHVYDAASAFADRFITPSATLPVIIGEFGPAADMTLAHCSELMAKADQLGVPYLAWTFHGRCAPNLVVDHSGGGCGIGMELEPTAWGSLLRDHLSSL